MSYYQGDFYQGDPGFLSGIGKFFGGAASFIPGVGGIISKGISALSRFKTKHPTLSAAGTAAAETGVGVGVGRMLDRRALAPARPMPGGAISPGGMMVHPGMAGQRGYHMSKPRKGVPSHLVRNRRMRVTNPRALRRAIRRAKGFERLARKVMHFVSPRAHKGRAVFRTRKRASSRI